MTDTTTPTYDYLETELSGSELYIDTWEKNISTWHFERNE